MRRRLAALLGAGLLLASLPATVAAARVTKFTDKVITASCYGQVDGGYISTFAEQAQEFTGSFIDVWFDPAVPNVDQQSATGSSDAVDVSESAGGVTMSITWELVDGSTGDPLEDASMTAVMAKVGDPVPDPRPPKSNHHSATVVLQQSLEGTAAVTVLGIEYEVPCFGTIATIDVFEANPTSFITNDEGVQIDCFWQTDTAIAGLFVVGDTFGFFADTFLVTADTNELNADSSGSIDATGFQASMNLADADTGEPNGATASASGVFEIVGDPVTTFVTQQNSRSKQVEQLLSSDGSLDFSTGESFPLDAEHCTAEAFANHFINTAPKGPRPGKAPANDTPDGAISLKLGSTLNAQTTSTALDPEQAVTTCPGGRQDDLGHTLWYTVEGTGGDVTVDSTGSNFDTVVAVYTRDGDSWTEVGCEDDVALEPIGVSFQAILTVPTDEGVTYYIQAGGFRRFFQPELVQSGRLRLSIY